MEGWQNLHRFRKRRHRLEGGSWSRSFVCLLMSSSCRRLVGLLLADPPLEHPLCLVERLDAALRGARLGAVSGLSTGGAYCDASVLPRRADSRLADGAADHLSLGP